MRGDPADLDAYFARIGYSDRREATLAVLRAIVARHTAVIPFENLDVLLGRPIRLDLSSLQHKLLREQRGGYCFEHNTLLMAVLRALGFGVTSLAARVRWGRPQNVVGARTHMLLRVELADGPYIADVGFGGLTPTAPLALVAGREQTTPHETFRLAPAGREFDLEARQAEGWTSLYRFSLQEQAPADYEVANWFTSTHPNALFVRHLVGSRPGPGCRYTLFDNRFSVRELQGKTDRRMLTGADDLGDVLARRFGIVPTNLSDLATLAGLVERRAAEAHADPFEHD